ncbi:uncharacterized protein LOC122293598 [Carya illinoinensis]|uniref:uncharacterized protein LOC122293598 n=1 Tax=Carya illinoinensis TaxID=32201 RepID=UPI001C7295D6|nr:uncharacterized protein LOC122293598 [Carya illinoinensis]
MGGKICIFWSQELKFEVSHMSDQLISGIFISMEQSLLVSFVYAKCRQSECQEHWKDLELVQKEEVLWLVAGDFNIIWSDAKRIGGNPRPLSAMEDFNCCLDNCGLMELGVNGGKMSLCNGHNGATRSWAKLDRALSNANFLQRFPTAQFEYGKRKSSDYNPMIICPSPFHFQNMWCTHPSFLECIEGAWREDAHGTRLIRLAEKLKRTKVAI